MKAILIKPYFEYVKNALPGIELYHTPEECSDAEVLIGLAPNVEVEILEKLPKLKWIQLLSAGYDNINLKYLKNRNITLTNGRGIYSIPIAEDVLCKILMSNCNALRYLDNQKKHIWQPYKGRVELCAQTVGIIGTGSIATEIAKRLQAFGVKVLGYKRTPVEAMMYFDEVYFGKDKLNYILSVSDYIVVTTDLNEDTFHLLNKSNLKYMKKDASIINIARGSIINQQDLIELLKNNNIKYAGLDVYETEPLPAEDELWKLDNVYLTPHTSGTVENNKDRIHNLIIDNIKRDISNESLMNIIKL